LHRTWGGILAGSLFVLPSVFILWTLSFVYVTFGKVPFISALFYGLKPVVVGIVAAAVLRIGKKALRNEIMYAVAAAAFTALFFLRAPFPLVILIAAVIGLIGGKFWPEKFAVLESHGICEIGSADHSKPTFMRAIRVILVCVLLWWAPVLAAGKLWGWENVLFQEGVFFSKAAMITFGGAYAVLPYVSQQAVEGYQWLSAPQMLDGLGLAETTPGPLIMVLQFVGFLGAWHHPGTLPPLLAATLGAFITTWTTFVPCFLWIFLGAPYIERLRAHQRLTAALSTVTAAVAGVILNLALWFGMHVIFPEKQHVDWFAFAAATVTFIGMAKWKWNVVPVVLGGAIAGWLYRSITGL